MQVLKVDKAEDYSTTGRWVVTTCTVQGSAESEEKMSSHFDGVILCLGFFSVPHIPHIPGLVQEFKGTVRHVGSYRNPQPFRGRTVIVVDELTGLVNLCVETGLSLLLVSFDWFSEFMCMGRTVGVVGELVQKEQCKPGWWVWLCRDRTSICFTFMNICWVPHLKMSPKDLTMATMALLSLHLYSSCMRPWMSDWCYTCVTALSCKRSWSVCQKCRWHVTAKYACTLRVCLCMKWHGT